MELRKNVKDSMPVFFRKQVSCILFIIKLYFTLKPSLDIAGFEQIQRACGFSPDGQNGCQTQEVAGVQVEYCYCTSDNCNQDNQCSCSSGSSSGKMKCQHCGTLESGYKCDSPDDQGESKECLAPGMVCFYHKYDNGDTYRGCTIESGPEVCFEADDSKKCQCQTENCNIDEECYPQSRCDF